ncbi:hypothetical protein, partial [Helicobacter sp. 13S00482-2]|uniref:hypothetical protein n=1 Tax=Helicobacter sp. 13S00482-2 TaxID=1476200 RepID=UPI0021519365
KPSSSNPDFLKQCGVVGSELPSGFESSFGSRVLRSKSFRSDFAKFDSSDALSSPASSEFEVSSPTASFRFSPYSGSEVSEFGSSRSELPSGFDSSDATSEFGVSSPTSSRFGVSSPASSRSDFYKSDASSRSTSASSDFARFDSSRSASSRSDFAKFDSSRSANSRSDFYKSDALSRSTSSSPASSRSDFAKFESSDALSSPASARSTPPSSAPSFFKTLCSIKTKSLVLSLAL